MDSTPTAPDPAADAIGLYVHLPFCTTKCGYCDFYSLPTIPHLVDDLVCAIILELSRRRPSRRIETVFIGGGTPTVLPSEALDRILTAVGEAARIGGVAPEEWTVEANPSSTDELKLELLRRHGVDRVSFGAQSFHPDELAVLERIHDPRHIGESVSAARRAGFDNVNLDLIFGVPGQTPARWRDNLLRAIDLGVEHLSCYSLMYEPGTAMTRLRREGRILPCDEDAEAEMFETTIDLLTAAGYEHYEISNYARPGRRCRANLIYWMNDAYLGVGPSAVSYLDGERRKNVADVRRYVEAMLSGGEGVVMERERLDPIGRARETAVQMLRLTEGIDEAAFMRRTGFEARMLFAEAIDRFTAMNLLETCDGFIRLTRRGRMVANRVMEEFVDTGEAAATRGATVGDALRVRREGG
jgi:oxygen-independent coproporphyrinogen-3 oxidase